jgi:hypothetical protein
VFAGNSYLYSALITFFYSCTELASSTFTENTLRPPSTEHHSVTMLS